MIMTFLYLNHVPQCILREPTCQGNSFCSAFTPPTILAVMDDTPQEQAASREAACRSWANSTSRTLLKWDLMDLVTTQEQVASREAACRSWANSTSRTLLKWDFMDLITNQEQVASREAACRSWANSTSRTLLKWV